MHVTNTSARLNRARSISFGSVLKRHLQVDRCGSYFVNQVTAICPTQTSLLTPWAEAIRVASSTRSGGTSMATMLFRALICLERTRSSISLKKNRSTRSRSATPSSPKTFSTFVTPTDAKFFARLSRFSRVSMIPSSLPVYAGPVAQMCSMPQQV
jgi:hypothetical protein